LTKLGKGDASNRWPQFLPDGKHVIFVVGRGAGFGGGANTNSIDVVAIDTGARSQLVQSFSSGDYSSGYLLFRREQSLVAQPFDIKHLRLTGDVFPVVEAIGSNSTARSLFSVDDHGDLAYRTGTVGMSQLQWFDRSGKLLGTASGLGDYRFPAISHDGHKVAVGISDNAGANPDIWVLDLDRATSTRL